MGEITIVGLGPGLPGLMTLAVWDKLSGAARLLLRTAKHPAADALKRRGISFTAYDALAASEGEGGDADEAIARDVIKKARNGEKLVYAVPGNPFTTDRTAALISEKAEALDIAVQIHVGASFFDLLCVDTRPLVDVMARLRSPGGCVWDIEQTHRSLRRNLIEEVYEVVEAIDLENPALLCEELGDLLLQVVFHARMAEESGAFKLQDVVDGIAEKLVRRHPHVFGDVTVADAGEVVRNWDAIKRQEKANERKNVLDGVPKDMPALTRAAKLQSKASKVGFDWDNAAPVWDKIREEIAELKEAIAAGDERAIEAEFGDVLFSVVNLSRFIGVDAEVALTGTIQKFIRRFSHVEESVRARGLAWEEMSPDALDRLWNEAKVIKS